MDVGRILVSALVGGAAGALLALIAVFVTKKFTPDMTKERRQMILGVCAAVSGTLGGTVQFTNLHSPSSAEAALREAARPLLADPRIQQKIKGMSKAEVGAYAESLTASGVRHLSATDLDTWGRFKLRFTEFSPAICAGTWKGGVDPSAFLKGLEKLSESERRQWSELMSRAALASLDAKAPIPLPEDIAARAFAEMVTMVPEAERAAFEADLGRADLSDARACELAKMVFSSAMGLPQPLRTDFYRALATNM